MPLGPKQLPPYYTPEAMPTPGTGYARLHYDDTPNVTSGTTETDIYTYTIPANTLNNIGDQLTIEYTALPAEDPETHNTKYYLDGAMNFASNTNDSAGAIKWVIKMTKMSPTEIRSNFQIDTYNMPTLTLVQDQTVDFTLPIELKFTGQCTGIATITGWSLTIDKIQNS